MKSIVLQFISYHASLLQVEEILQQIDLDSPSVCVTRLINILFNTLELYESMGILSQHITKVSIKLTL